MTSQILAIYYLNEVDHYIKENLGFKYYIRYMDDLIILSEDKARLEWGLNKIKNMLDKYKLEANSKTKIYDLSKGFKFLGYKINIKNNSVFIKANNKTNRKIKKRLKLLMESDLNKYKLSLSSYKGYFLRISKCFLDSKNN